MEEEESLFSKEIMAKLAYFISLWYMGKATDFEDFKNLENLFNQDNKKVEPVPEESKENSE